MEGCSSVVTELNTGKILKLPGAPEEFYFKLRAFSSLDMLFIELQSESFPECNLGIVSARPGFPDTLDQIYFQSKTIYFLYSVLLSKNSYV